MGVVLLLLGLWATVGCRGEGRPSEVAKLSDDDWYALCGIWVRIEARNVSTTQGRFSWGSARHVPNFSLNIDLGAIPPYVSLPAAFMQIEHAERAEGTGIQIRAAVKQTGLPDNSVELVVNLNDDGTIWFSRGAGFIGEGKGFTYFRIDGPKKGT